MNQNRQFPYYSEVDINVITLNNKIVELDEVTLNGADTTANVARLTKTGNTVDRLKYESAKIVHVKDCSSVIANFFRFVDAETARDASSSRVKLAKSRYISANNCTSKYRRELECVVQHDNKLDGKLRIDSCRRS